MRAALHRGHRRERELPGQVAGRVDVRHVGAAVLVDGHVAAVVHLDAGGVEAEALAVRAPSRWRAGRGCPAAARPSSQRTDDPVVGAVDADGPGALEQADAPAEELVLERGRHLRVLLGEHLLAGHDQRDLAAERAEHVDELHAGHARADHDEVLGPARAAGRRRGWRAPARRRRRPSRGAGAGCRWRAGRRRPRPRRRRRPCRPPRVRGRPAARARGGCARPGCRAAAASPCSSLLLDGLDARLQGVGVDRRPTPRVRPISGRAPDRGQGAAGGDHRLGRDAVPQVGGAADHVLLDDRDLGAEPGGVGGRGVARPVRRR